MTERYHCIFKNCSCNKYKLRCSGRCICNHGKVWHSRYKKPPCDEYLSFVSPRQLARKPIYIKKYLNIEVFLPKVPPLPSDDEEIVYCPAYIELPV
jgi:hypothetical protein